MILIIFSLSGCTEGKNTLEGKSTNEGKYELFDNFSIEFIKKYLA